MLIEMISLILN